MSLTGRIVFLVISAIMQFQFTQTKAIGENKIVKINWNLTLPIEAMILSLNKQLEHTNEKLKESNRRR
ncbi:putative potassium transport system protein Kup [Dirofilaria immitis]